MKSLFRLWFLKTKGTIRNLFKRKASGVFVILTIIGYGFIFMSMFSLKPGTIMNVDNIDLHMSILLFIGYLVLMLFSTLMQPRKALFMGEDAFYLFSGPFTRKQIMIYLILQTVIQSLFLSLFGLFILGVLGRGILGGFFVFMAYLASVFAIQFFLVLTDYVYVLSIGEKKYQKYAKIIPAVIFGFVAIVVLVLFIQTGNYHTLFMDFVKSDLFYVVPVFGWIKLALISYVEHNYLMMFLGYALLVVSMLIVYGLFISYKGDFVEQALQDSLELSKQMKAAKAGDQNALRKNKVKLGVHGSFRSGAYAIMSKNFLLMKKTNSFISPNDLISIGIYIVVSIATGFGFGMFIYMMIIWIFSALQNSDLSKELMNYQIYLIPDKPLNKLMAVIIPTFVKVVLITSVTFIAMGLFYHQSAMSIVMYLLNIIGYTSVFISGSVLSIRILKSRSSPIFENLIRMLVMIIGAIPSALILSVFLFNGGMKMLSLASYISLLVNLVISLIILFACRNMMNGRELKSE